MIGRMSRFDWLAQFFRPLFRAGAKAKRVKREPACPPRQWDFEIPGAGLVKARHARVGPANTKSEARALLKRQLGRIPVGSTARPVAEKAAA